jgi:plastocyanin
MIICIGLASLALACGGDDDNGGGDDATATRPPATGTASAGGSPTGAVGSPTVAATSPMAPAPATSPPASPTAAGGGDEAVTVVATDFAFNPSTISGSMGATLTITMQNNGAAPHTLTVFADAGYSTAVPGGDTGNISGGATGTASIELTQGQYFFRCTIHPSLMEGTISAN